MVFDNNLFGFDVSYYQGAIDFNRMKTYGAKFLVVRAGYGLWKDPQFDRYMADSNGLFPTSVYHYYDPRYDPTQQAKALLGYIEQYRSRIRRVWLDLEFTWSGSYSDSKYWKVYRNAIVAAGYKVGWYTRKTWWDGMVGSYYTEVGQDPLWAAQYNVSLTLIPKGWTKAMIWQDGTPAIGGQAGVSSKEIDHDLWNTDYNFTQEWGDTPYYPPVEHTNPYSGVDYYKGVVNGVNYYVFLIDMNGKSAKITNLKGGVDFLSNVAQKEGAQIAFNADEYDKNIPHPPYWPRSLAYSDGVKYVDQFEYRWFMNIGQNNQLNMSFNDYSNLWNVTSFTRPLITNGQKEAYLNDPTKIENIEIHARSAKGISKDGKLMAILIDGKVDPNTGIAYEGATLPQLADLFIQYGAMFAGEHGGGGDVGAWLTDRIITGFSDPSERATVQQLLIFTGGDMTADYYDITPTDTDNHSVRGNYAITAPKIGNLAQGGHAKAGTTSADVYVYTDNVPNGSGGYYALKGDTWRKVYELNGKAIDGWIAEIHLSVKQNLAFNLVTVTPTNSATVVFEWDDTMNLTKITVNGVAWAKV